MTHFTTYILAPAIVSLLIVAVCRMMEVKDGTPAYIKAISWLVCVLATFMLLSIAMLTQEMYLTERHMKAVDEFVGHNTIIPDDTINNETAED